MNNILETKKIIKDFPGVRALNNVSVDIRENEIHAICGENGAGKSTLINILSGVHPYGTYSGKILMNGDEMKFHSIKDAENSGIAVIHQELTLFEELNITENIFMNHQRTKGISINWDYMNKETAKWLEKLKLNYVKPTVVVKNLGVGKQQLIEIAKALMKKSKILILDEPTASLTEQETEILFDIIKELKKEGVTCIYISHKLDEVFEIADRITVLRDGESIDTKKIGEINEAEIVKMMVGREINQMYPKRTNKPGKEILRIENFDVYDVDIPDKKSVDNANFELRKGEILGISGLMGAGRTELVSSIYGGYSGKWKGKVFFKGEEIRIKKPSEALKKGFAFLSEDRKGEGLISTMDVKENVTIAFLKKFVDIIGINQNKLISSVNKVVDDLDIKTPSLKANITTLSGGNQQKVLLGRNLLFNPKILIMDEPTRGIDVGAKHEIYVLMNELTKSGISIIMVSSELPEILGMSDRIIILKEGNIVKEFDNENKSITQEDVMIYAAGGN